MRYFSGYIVNLTAGSSIGENDMTYRPTPPETALLTAHLIAAYDQEKAKTTTRARISARTLRRISSRGHLRDVFLNDWTDELAELGWAVFPVGDHFALIQVATIEAWTRIGSQRLRPLLQRVRAGDNSVFEQLHADLAPEDQAIDDE